MWCERAVGRGRRRRLGVPLDQDSRDRSESDEDACTRVRARLPAAALDALDPTEVAEVAQHLEVCHACRHDYLELRRVRDLLALAVPSRMPPPALRARVLAAIQPPRRLPLVSARVWAALAAALIVLLVGSNALLWRELRIARSEIRVETLAAGRATPSPATGSNGAASGGPRVWYDLASTAPNSGASGILCAQSRGRLAWLITEGLPALPPGRIYQAWLINGNQRQSAGTFTVDDRGRGFLTIRLDRPLTDYQSMGVTVEPEGGSPTPTGARYLAGVLQS